MKVVMHRYLVVYLNVGINLEFTKKWSATKEENSVICCCIEHFNTQNLVMIIAFFKSCYEAYIHKSVVFY